MKMDKKIKELETNIQALKKSKEQVQKELEEKKELLFLSNTATNSKKAGNGWLIVAAILIVAEIVLLFEGSFNFRFLDFIIIGIPLVVGIKKKKNNFKAYKNTQEKLQDVDTEKLPKQIEDLEKKLLDLEVEIEVIDDEISGFTAYKGKNWDMKTFTATPENVQQLEKDAENLLVSVQYITDKKKVVDNWLCNNRMESLTAILSQNGDLEKTLNRGFEEMGKSGSWKLRTLQLVIASFDLTLLHIGLGADKPLSFEELTGRTEGYRAPQTQDEKDFYEVAMAGSKVINSAIEYALK